jgi:ATP-dependent RNA helicase SUPV3L1/SUV3
MPARLRAFEAAPDSALCLGPDGKLAWRGAPIARLAAGISPLQPKIEPLAGEYFDTSARELLRQRSEKFLGGYLRQHLGALAKLGDARFSDGAARGLAFRLLEGLGTLRRPDADDLLPTLGRGARRHLTKLGLRIGREHVWIAGALTPTAVRARALLWCIASSKPVPELPKAGRKLMPAASELSDEFYRSIGYRRAGPCAWRIDAFEALADAIFAEAREGAFAVGPRLITLAGGAAPLADALMALGARHEPAAEPGGPSMYRVRSRARKGRGRRRSSLSPRPESPFAALEILRSGS